MPRIYCCFIHFILFFIIPLLNEVEGVYTGFTFPVCPSMDRTVSAVYLPQYYSHILSPNVRRCVALWVCEKFQNLNFGNFFKFAPFTLSYVHVVWMIKVDSSSMLLLKQILIFRGETSSWFDKRKFRVRPKLQLRIFGIFLIVHYHLVFVVTSKIELIPFYCSHFEWPEIRHADVFWPP